jgi:hypothetical protein
MRRQCVVERLIGSNGERETGPEPAEAPAPLLTLVRLAVHGWIVLTLTASASQVAVPS